MIGRFALVGAILVVLLVLPSGAASGSHYLPKTGDSFRYHDIVTLTNGSGNYTGYSESAAYDGSIAVTWVGTNGTDGSTYQSSGTWTNNQGQSRPWSESGSFTFSPATFHYVQGTDNQTGYLSPFLWFYVNNSLANHSTFFILNTQLTIVSLNFPYRTSIGTTGAVKTVFAEGNGSYQRSDVYGTFVASYTYKAYFDPGTGYIVGYVYTESDSDSSGNGFTWTDTLADTQTTGFALTSTAPPANVLPPTGPTGGFAGLLALEALAVVLVLVVVVVLVVALAVTRRGRGGMGRAPLPRHVESGGPMLYAPPPPINLTPGDQPPIQQIVMRETVKVPCRYCGTLMDSTATVCPKCGAPRT